MMPRNFFKTAVVLMLGILSPACSAAGPGEHAAGSDSARPVHVIAVGPGKALQRPSMAAKAAHDGDTIEIEAGTYAGDAAIWRQNNLTIRGVNGRAHLKAAGADAEDKGIWVIKGKNTTVENIEFSGARVHDRNGAGIRQEGANLTVRHCSFNDNQNGILAGANPESEIVIENSEFANNGEGDGQTHNMYIGAIKRFTLRASYSHHADIGHNVKSRARETFLLYNRIMDEQTGTASYEVDLPNGGRAYLIGNLIQKGPQADNTTLVAYGKEGLPYATNELYIVNNTMVSDFPDGGRFVVAPPTVTAVKIMNNIFAGSHVVVTAAGEASHNLQSNNPGFVNRAGFDYHLKPGSPAIDAGMVPGAAGGFQLAPVAEYVNPLSEQARPQVGALDVGAYETR